MIHILGLIHRLPLQQNELSVSSYTLLYSSKGRWCLLSVLDTHTHNLRWDQRPCKRQVRSAWPRTSYGWHCSPKPHSPGGSKRPWAAGQNKFQHQCGSTLMWKRNHVSPEFHLFSSVTSWRRASNSWHPTYLAFTKNSSVQKPLIHTSSITSSYHKTGLCSLTCFWVQVNTNFL